MLFWEDINLEKSLLHLSAIQQLLKNNISETNEKFRNLLINFYIKHREFMILWELSYENL